MQLTEQQRAELERRGWKVADHQDQFWQYIELTRGQTALRLDKLGIDIPRNAYEPSLRDVAEIAAVLGITPPGYRLVPEETLRKAVAELTDDGSSDETAAACISEGVALMHEAERLRGERRYRQATGAMAKADDRFAEGQERLAAVRDALASALQGKEVHTHG